MAFQRKIYQETALDVLKKYLETARVHGTQSAFERVTKEVGQARTYKPLLPLPDVPYICLRIPTGGGKTYMAARSASIAADMYLEDEYPIILWLVPTKVIPRANTGNPQEAQPPQPRSPDGGVQRARQGAGY